MPGPELADTVISERAGIRGHDHFGTAQHECPGCFGKLTVEADHHADPDRPTSGVQAGHRERLARGEPSFERPVAGMDFCIGEDITAVPVDDRRRVARRAWPPLQVGDRNSDLGPGGRSPGRPAARGQRGPERSRPRRGAQPRRPGSRCSRSATTQEQHQIHAEARGAAARRQALPQVRGRIRAVAIELNQRNAEGGHASSLTGRSCPQRQRLPGGWYSAGFTTAAATGQGPAPAVLSC